MRRIDQFRAERVTLQYDFAQSADADITYRLFEVPAGRRFVMERAYVNLPAGLAEHSANWVDFQIKNGSTVVANWSTDSDLAGTNSIVANTPKTLTPNADPATKAFAAGEFVDFVANEDGTTTIPAGRVVVEGYLL